MKCYPSTKFQMEVLARKSAEQRVAELEEQLKRQEERHAEERQNFMEVMSHNGSNSRHHVSPRSENVDDAHRHDAPFQEDEHYGDNEDHDTCPRNSEYLFAQRRRASLAMQSHQHSPNTVVQTHATSPYQCNPNNTAAPVAQHLTPLLRRRFSNNAAPTVQHGAVQPNATSSHQSSPNNVLPAVQHDDVAQQAEPNAHDAAQEMQPNAHDAAQEVQSNAAKAKPVQPKVGMKVILFEMVRSSARVAVGTITSTNPKTTIGGVALGKQYCEVVVNHVLKRDASLPRTYAGVEKMADAHKLHIAWPYNKLKVWQQTSKSVTKASKPPQGV